MIKIIDGDLLESGADLICHQVNCQGKMNSGVAKQIRNKWSSVYDLYLSAFAKEIGFENPLGKIQIASVDNGERCVINCFAQDNYGYDGKQYTDVNALKKCFEQILGVAKSTKRNNGKDLRIAMPYKIGCVRGGANWDEVYAIIEEVFKDCNVELWRLDKG